jgi:FkbM family methyltransferase
MKILFVVKQKKNVDTFIATIRALVDRGHSVALAVQERTEEHDDRYREEIDSPRFSVVRAPAHRADDWAEIAWLQRSLRDCVHYQQPALRGAAKLQARSVHKLREELRIQADNEAVAAALREMPPQQVHRLDAVLELAEQKLPNDPLYDEFLRSQAPDLLLLSPLVHFGSAQADLVASANALGVPVGMVLYSWDNLSTKGCLHRPPDRMFVWNEGQRREAHELHGFPPERVVIAGAPRFDRFFELQSRVPRTEFHDALGLDAGQPTLCYVCSSQFVSAGELAFVRKWLATIRASGSERLRQCNVVVRPHPDIALLDSGVPVREVRWPSVRGAKGFASPLDDDPRAVVLRTSDRSQQGFFECIHHSAAVIGLNTSAELEAAIVGRPVFTILAGDDADGQSSTLHFRYLLEEDGGCVRVARALDEHVAQLESELETPQDGARLRRFVGQFLRPLGTDRPVSPLLADAIETAFSGDAAPEGREAAGTIAPSAARVVRAPIAGADAGERRVVPLSLPKLGYEIQVYASSGEPPDPSPSINKHTVQWLRDHVTIGDVIYDVDAGAGFLAIIAAKYHGAVVVAFEPGYAVFTDLCENARVNGCDGSVMAVPLALADFEGMGELKYPSGKPGQARHTVRPTTWRVRRAAGEEGHFRQHVCVTSLDAAARRYALPEPAHLHIGTASAAVSVLAGAVDVLTSSALKTVFCTLSNEEGDAVAERVAPLNWVTAQRISLSRGRTHLLLAKQTATAASVRSDRR